MLANSCLSCHSNTTAASSGNGIRLQDYADVKSRAISIAGAIKHSGGYSPMPNNVGQLKACPIAQFYALIKYGMPDN
jgi:mono/diheme cytochrome c family protein